MAAITPSRGCRAKSSTEPEMPSASDHDSKTASSDKAASPLPAKPNHSVPCRSWNTAVTSSKGAPETETARTVAANNIVNSGAMVVGSLIAFALSSAGVGPTGQLLLVAAMCIIAAWLGWKLHLACD